jgi:hypothetical protein
VNGGEVSIDLGVRGISDGVRRVSPVTQVSSASGFGPGSIGERRLELRTASRLQHACMAQIVLLHGVQAVRKVRRTKENIRGEFVGRGRSRTSDSKAP